MSRADSIRQTAEMARWVSDVVTATDYSVRHSARKTPSCPARAVILAERPSGAIALHETRARPKNLVAAVQDLARTGSVEGPHGALFFP